MENFKILMYQSNISLILRKKPFIKRKEIDNYLLGCINGKDFIGH
jgi:hypothetical protein